MNAVSRLRSLPLITPLLLTLLVTLSQPTRAPGDPLDHWTFLQPDLTLEGLRAGHFQGPINVIVGDHGLIAYSSDTISWTRAEIRIPNHFYSVTYGSDRYVAVGDFGAIVTSPDGIRWSQAFNLSLNTLREVAYGAGQFVAVGDNAQILVSNDGLHWTTALSGSIDLKSVCYGLNHFIAVGDEGVILSSPDGNFWSREFSPTTRNFTKVRFGNGMILASASFARARDGLPGAEFHTTQNLSEWRSIGPPISTVADLALVSNQWVVAGTDMYFENSNPDNRITTRSSLIASSDLAMWQSTYPGFEGVACIAQDSNSVGYLLARPSSLFVLSIPSLSDPWWIDPWWSNTSTNTSLGYYPRSPVTFKGQLILPSESGEYYRFEDPETWHKHTVYPIYSSRLASMVGNDEMLVAFANSANSGSNQIWISSNAVTWTLANHALPEPNWTVEKALYDNNSWICLNRQAKEIMVSSDLTNWNKLSLPLPPDPNVYLHDLSVHNSRWCISASLYSNGTNYALLSSSTNGVDWITQTFSNSSPLSVGHGNGIYYFTYFDGSKGLGLLKSADGLNWSPIHYKNPGGGLIVASDSQFLTWNSYGDVFSSPDLESWLLRESFSRHSDLSGKDLSRYTFDVSQMAYAFNCVFLFDSSGSTIVRSDPLTSPSTLLPSLELDRSGVLTLIGSPGNTYEIQSAASLAHPVPWVSITNMTLTSDLHSFAPSTPPPGTARFYRALLK